MIAIIAGRIVSWRHGLIPMATYVSLIRAVSPGTSAVCEGWFCTPAIYFTSGLLWTIGNIAHNTQHTTSDTVRNHAIQSGFDENILDETGYLPFGLKASLTLQKKRRIAP